MEFLRLANEISAPTWLFGMAALFLFLAVAGKVSWRGKPIVDPGPLGRALGVILGLLSLSIGVGLEISIDVHALADPDEVLVAEAAIIEKASPERVSALAYAVSTTLEAFEESPEPCDSHFLSDTWATTWGDMQFHHPSPGEVTATYGSDGGTLYLSADPYDCSVYEGIWVENDSKMDCHVAAVDDSRNHWGSIFMQTATSPPAFQAKWDYCGKPDTESASIWAGKKH